MSEARIYRAEMVKTYIVLFWVEENTSGVTASSVRGLTLEGAETLLNSLRRAIATYKRTQKTQKVKVP